MLTMKDFIKEPFRFRFGFMKTNIVRDGRPTPTLRWLQSSDLLSADGGDVYSRFPWLAGCEESKSLYCWPCLLFGNDCRNWTAMGPKDLVRGLSAHQDSLAHLQFLLQHQLFRYKNGLEKRSLVAVLSPSNPRDGVEALRRAIRAVLFEVSRQKTRKPAPVDLEDCLRTLEFLDTLEVLKTPCEDAVLLIRSTDAALASIVSGAARALRGAIKAEVQQASYVSVVLSGHSQRRQRLVSAVLRYVLDGLVRERFVGLHEVKKGGGADAAHRLVSQVLQDFDAHEKVVACSVDGSVLASSADLDALQTRLRDDYPFVSLLPCHLHDLDAVLEQSLSDLAVVRSFFLDLGVFRDSFSNNEKACRVLVADLGSSVTQGLPLDSISQFLTFLSVHRLQFVKYFESCLAGVSSSFWDPDDLPRAVALSGMLHSVETVFLLHTFAGIFRSTSRVRDALRSASFERAISIGVPGALKRDLEEACKPEAFEALWSSVRSDLFCGQEDTKDLSLQQALSPDKKPAYRELYDKIYQRVTAEVDRRLAPLPELLYFHLFDPEVRDRSFVREARGEGGEALCVAETPLESLLAVHGPRFEQAWVENEMQVFLRTNWDSPCRSVRELLQFFRSRDLTKTFRNLSGIAELILAMPCMRPPTDAESSGNSSKLKDIDRWAPLWEGQEDLVLLCVEEGFLDELKESPEFLDNVIRECAGAFQPPQRSASPPPTHVQDQMLGGPVIVEVQSISTYSESEQPEEKVEVRRSERLRKRV